MIKTIALSLFFAATQIFAASNLSVVYDSGTKVVAQTNLIQNFSSLSISNINVQAEIDTNTANITTVSNSVTVNTANITTVSNQVTGKASQANLTTVSNSVTANTANITTVSNTVTGNTANITTLSNAVTGGANTILGNNTGSTALPAGLTATQVRSLLSITNVDFIVGVLKYLGVISVDWQNDLLTDFSSVAAINWNQRILQNTSGTKVFDWTTQPAGLGISNKLGILHAALDAGTNMVITTNGNRLVLNSTGGGGGTVPTNWVAIYTVDTNIANTTFSGTNDIRIIPNWSGSFTLPPISNMVGRVVIIKDDFGTLNITPFNYPSSDARLNGVTNVYALAISNALTLIATGPYNGNTNYNWEVIGLGGVNGITLTTSGGTPDLAFTGNGTTTIGVNIANANGTGQVVKDHTPGLFYPTLFFDGTSGILFKSQADGQTKMQLLYPATGSDAGYIQFYDPASSVDFFFSLYLQGGRIDLMNLTSLNLGSGANAIDFTNKLTLVGLTNQLSVRNFASNAPAAILSSRLPVTKTTNYTLTSLDSGSTFNNNLSTSNIVLTLPATIAGLHYKISENTTDGITLQAPAGSTIRAFGLTNDTYTLNAAGYIIDVEAVNTTNWFVMGQPGLTVMTNDQPTGAALARINFKDTSTVTWAATNDATGSGKMNVFATAIFPLNGNNVVSKTANYTFTDADDTIIFGSNASLVGTVPTAVGRKGKKFTVKCANTTPPCSLTCSDFIDLSTTYSFIAVGGGVGPTAAVTIQSDGAQWWIISNFITP